MREKKGRKEKGWGREDRDGHTHTHTGRDRETEHF